MSNIPVPPLIPGSLMLQTLEVDMAKVTSILGPALATLNTWKSSCVVSTTTNIVLSGLQNVDGVSVAVGDRVLVKDQSLSVQNGIYIASENDWSRSEDLPLDSSASGVSVYINLGSVGAANIFACDNPLGLDVVGINDLLFQEFSGGAETLEDLTDVTVTAPAVGQSLLYSGTGWENGAPVASAGGNPTQVQYNNGGVLSGDGGMVFDSGTGTLTTTILNSTSDVAAVGTITGGTLTDGSLSSTAGTVTGVVDLTASNSLNTLFLNTTSITAIGTCRFGTNPALNGLAFYGVPAVVQQTVGIPSVAVSTPGVGSPVLVDTRWGGYEIGQIVQALKSYGLLA